MKCANPECHSNLLYLRGGTLRLLELEPPAASRIHGNGSGFSVSTPQTRYFWLCPECSKTMSLKRWTQEGLVIEFRDAADPSKLRTWTVVACPAVEARSVLYFPRPTARRA